jgi:CheY-like chemotaxis protein
MDIQMPVMNGFEATRRIRELDDPIKSKIPILATSANANQNNFTECIDCGMNELLSKPISIDALLHVIKKYTT